ncbi:MAG: FMN-binding protein [Sphaerochaetaceae bacterium]
MKKLSIILIVLTVMVPFLFFVGCAKKSETTALSYSDGFYFAIDDEYPSSGWKEYVTLTVKDGKIESANWNGIDKNGNDKKEYDKGGNYNMVKFGGAQAEWYEQAQRLEAFLISTQDPSKVTDSVSGVSIGTDEFVKLAAKALKAGPQKKGNYTDGIYYAIKDDFDSSGWKDYISVLILNGNIVDVYWSAFDKNNNDKKDYDRGGNYNMVKFGGAQAEWYEQAQRVENNLIKTQNSETVDAIGGVSISLGEFYELLKKALDK